MESFAWACNFPDIQKICRLFQLTALENPLRYSYTPIRSVLQNGPQCGIVALAMIVNHTQTDENATNKVMQVALEKEYTYNGEIFSAIDMYELTRATFGSKRNVELYEGDLNDTRIIEFMLNEGILLVPYDSDKDHSPCQLLGHKAHWAAVTGAAETEDDFYVFARHGKSSNVNVWRLKELALSNSQLNEFSPDRKLSDVVYKLPEGGIGGTLGLKSKAVLIYKSIS